MNKSNFRLCDRTAGTTPYLMPCENPQHLEPEPSPLYYGNGKLAPSAIQEKRQCKPVPPTTPRMPDGSPITARSCMYKTPFNVTLATVEFYRPPYSVYVQMKPGNLRDSITRGCPIFRHIGTDDDPNVKKIEDGYGDRPNEEIKR